MKALNRLLELRKLFKPVSAVLAISLVFACALHLTNAQSKAPYDKERLIKVVQLNALSTTEIIDAVNQRGVDFQVTAGVEAEFRQVGARPELIDALRRNYRAAPSVSTPTRPATTTPTTKPSTSVPAGAPLSKNEIVSMLQAGAPPARVEQFVEVRGVNFALTPEISREITAAGGNRSLLGAISERQAAAPRNNNQPTRQPTSPANTGPDYEELTLQAVSYMQANDSARAVRVLQQAVSMEPNRPTAYQLLGFAQLYGYQDTVSADRSMRAALERGGSAVFRVYHDHDGFFKTYCQGSLFVTRSAVTFKADDGNHTFEAQDSHIKQTELNDFVGSQFGAFHIKVYQTLPSGKDKGKSKTYNFAPATQKKAEANMITNLITSY